MSFLSQIFYLGGLLNFTYVCQGRHPQLSHKKINLHSVKYMYFHIAMSSTELSTNKIIILMIENLMKLFSLLISKLSGLSK